MMRRKISSVLRRSAVSRKELGNGKRIGGTNPCLAGLLKMVAENARLYNKATSMLNKRKKDQQEN